MRKLRVSLILLVPLQLALTWSRSRYLLRALEIWSQTIDPMRPLTLIKVLELKDKISRCQIWVSKYWSLRPVLAYDTGISNFPQIRLKIRIQARWLPNKEPSMMQRLIGVCKVINQTIQFSYSTLISQILPLYRTDSHNSALFRSDMHKYTQFLEIQWFLNNSHNPAIFWNIHSGCGRNRYSQIISRFMDLLWFPKYLLIIDK